eukprot:scaffold3437_cov113-Cylindrotheca_fusiformis.AAC.52
MMNTSNDQHLISHDSADERLSGLHSHDFDNDGLRLTDISSMNMKSPNMQVRSGSVGLLGSEVFEIGGSPVKMKQTAGCEVDMNLPFPIKLHYMLSQPSFQDCITWLPHGRAWKVIDQQKFESKVIPRFFRSDKMASFMRQVNGWAFNRITEGPDMNAYYHEMFLRGLPNLCFDMKRPPKVKHAAAAARLAAGAGLGAPDFDRISKIAPLPQSFPFKPIMKDAKGESSDKYGLELEESDGNFELLEPNENMNEDQPSDSSLGTNDELRLTKADVHYLKHQNEILFQHGKIGCRSGQS